MDLIIESKIFHEGDIRDVNIGILDGKIAEVKKDISGYKRKRVEGLIIPAMLDLHVHFRDPGYTYKEDFETGSLSALFGGVSFVMDMPNTNPVTDTTEAFEEKRKIANSKSYVDFGLFASVAKTYNLFLVDRASAFKLYMTETTGIHPENLDVLIENAKKITEKKRVFVHAELLENLNKSKDLKQHSLNRSEASEINAIRMLIAQNAKNLHITHISTPDSIPYINAAGYTSDVTPHHLFLNYSLPLSAMGKTNPPIRSKYIADKLWDLLIKGAIDFVASDHAPHALEEKEEFETAPSGVPNIETTLPLFLGKFKNEEIGMNKILKILMEKPAEFMNIKKGKIEKGYDADLVAFKLSDLKKIRARDLHYKCEWTPYEGFEAIFPHTVFLKGTMAIEQGHVLISPGHGKFV